MLIAACKRSVALNWPIIAIIGLYIVAGSLLARTFGFQLKLSLYAENLLLFGVSAHALAFLVAISFALARERPPRPFLLVAEKVRAWAVAERLILALPVFLIFPLFMSAFTSVKNAIPVMHPFDLDPYLVRADLALHGQAPWRLLQPLLGHPLITTTVNFFYNLWFIVWAVVLVRVMAWKERLELRAQFIIAFLLCWALLGSLAAIMLSSVGPCFYGLFYPADPFAAQMSYLRAANEVSPVWSLTGQRMLYDGVNLARPGMGLGISAMPSLHVAIATLLVFLACKTNRWLTTASIVFLLLIMLGSVHLAWHYAVDGYVAALATWPIWVLSGLLARLGLSPLRFGSTRIGPQPAAA